MNTEIPHSENQPTDLDRYYDVLAYIRHEVTRALYDTMTTGLKFDCIVGRTLIVTMTPSAAVWWTRCATLVNRALAYAGFFSVIVNPSPRQRAELSIEIAEAAEVEQEMAEA